MLYHSVVVWSTNRICCMYSYTEIQSSLLLHNVGIEVIQPIASELHKFDTMPYDIWDHWLLTRKDKVNDQ